MPIGMITRKLDNMGLEYKRYFSRFTTKTDFDDAIRRLAEADNITRKNTALADLYEMLEPHGIDFKEGMDTKYYTALAEKLNLPDFSEIEKDILYMLFTQFYEFPAPKDYMRRIISKLSGEELDENANLRLLILKRFIEYGNYLSDAGFGGMNVIKKYVAAKISHSPTTEEILSELDDDIFTSLDSATKEQKKPKGKYGLLKLCDDLAEGKFRTGGNTRRGLYLFAMAYNMTYSRTFTDDTSHTDIEKNLFRDYYCNNLMRFITDSYRGKLCEYDMNPSGQGINYKNFAEMIYIYYIASSNYSPAEKIKLSSEMITRVSKKLTEKNEKKEKSPAPKNTSYYRNVYTDIILAKDEDEFEKFMVDEYSISDEDLKAQKSDIAVSSEQKSAYKAYLEVMRLLDKELAAEELTLDSCNYGLWFTDVAYLKKIGGAHIAALCPDASQKQLDDFIELLYAVNEYLGYTVTESESKNSVESKDWINTSKGKTKALYIDNEMDITRTAIIVAYYYYFNAKYCNGHTKKPRRFDDIFTQFSQGVKPYLQRAYYQELNPKSIFDVMVVFSSYAYINN